MLFSVPRFLSRLAGLDCGKLWPADLEDRLANLPSLAGRNSHNEPRLLKIAGCIFEVGSDHGGGRRRRYHLAMLEPVNLRDPVGEELYGSSDAIT